MIIGLATPGVASSLDDGLEKIQRLMSEASAQTADIVCFPEAYVPGLRSVDIDMFPFDPAQQERVLQTMAQWSRKYKLATIHGTERWTSAGRQIASYVFDREGHLQ